jgi:hypothetical protein
MTECRTLQTVKRAYGFHHVGLNQEFLTIYLRDAGFTDIRRVDNFGLLEDTRRLLFKGLRSAATC